MSDVSPLAKDVDPQGTDIHFITSLLDAREDKILSQEQLDAALDIVDNADGAMIKFLARLLEGRKAGFLKAKQFNARWPAHAPPSNEDPAAAFASSSAVDGACPNRGKSSTHLSSIDTQQTQTPNRTEPFDIASQNMSQLPNQDEAPVAGSKPLNGDDSQASNTAANTLKLSHSHEDSLQPRLSTHANPSMISSSSHAGSLATSDVQSSKIPLETHTECQNPRSGSSSSSASDEPLAWRSARRQIHVPEIPSTARVHGPEVGEATSSSPHIAAKWSDFGLDRDLVAALRRSGSGPHRQRPSGFTQTLQYRQHLFCRTRSPTRDDQGSADRRNVDGRCEEIEPAQICSTVGTFQIQPCRRCHCAGGEGWEADLS